MQSKEESIRDIRQDIDLVQKQIAALPKYKKEAVRCQVIQETEHKRNQLLDMLYDLKLRLYEQEGRENDESNDR